MRLAQDHIERGSQYKVGTLNEQEAIENFERESEEYERVVRDANEQKQSLRQEIAQLEIELRKLRDQVADKQVENRSLAYLLEREEELKRHKNQLEKSALSALSNDLEDQLSTLQENAEKITGKVTPFGMEQVLQAKFKNATTAYQKFLEESEKDLKDA